MPNLRKNSFFRHIPVRTFTANMPDMLPFIRHCLLLCFTVLCSAVGYAQVFYANTGVWGLYFTPYETYRLRVNPCDVITDTSTARIFTCPPVSTGIDTVYNDIAIDKFDNLWYLTFGGNLYRRKLDDTNSCQYVTKVPSMLGAALVADTAGSLYIAGNLNDSGRVFKYDTNGLHFLGFLPKDMLVAGDLFFYEHRLFMTCNDVKIDTGYIIEIVTADPSQSCYFMKLDSTIAYGAFTVVDNNKSRVYITTANRPDFDRSDLLELDMVNRKTGRVVRRFSKDMFPHALDVSYLDAGLYLLHLRFTSGQTWTGKVLKH